MENGPASEVNDDTNGKTQHPVDEQKSIESLNEDSGRIDVPDNAAEEASEASKDEQADKTTPKSDPRADQLEALAERSSQRRRDEAAASQEAFAKPDLPQDETKEADATDQTKAAEADPIITLRIRGKDVQMPLSEVKDRAQKVEAADDYFKSARETIDQLNQIKRDVQKDPEQTGPEAEEKIDRIAMAIEAIQMGEDPAKAREMLSEEISSQAELAAQRQMEKASSAGREQRYDADVNSGYAAAREQFSDTMSDRVNSYAVDSIYTGLQGELISTFLSDADENTQAAFAQGGLTPESVKRLPAQTVQQVYKDMILKGYGLTRPSEVYLAAAKVFTERFSGTTRPDATAQHKGEEQPQKAEVSVDRKDRKENLKSPERTSVNRDGGRRPAPPVSETDRAAKARAEMQRERKVGRRVS